MANLKRFGVSLTERMAAAVATMIDEHGAPNSFAPGEIAQQYPTRRYIHIRDKWVRATDYGVRAYRICQVLQRHGYEVTYNRDGRRFRIYTIPQSESY